MTPLILTAQEGGERLDAFVAGQGEELTRSAAQRLLVEHGVFPGDFLRRPPGERAVVCALLIDHKRREEGEI